MIGHGTVQVEAVQDVKEWEYDLIHSVWKFSPVHSQRQRQRQTGFLSSYVQCVNTLRILVSFRRSGEK